MNRSFKKTALGNPVRVDPENPSTVPVEWRHSMIGYANEFPHPERDGVLQMLTDLLALAMNDGCIAAGWALQRLGIHPEVESE